MNSYDRDAARIIREASGPSGRPSPEDFDNFLGLCYLQRTPVDDPKVPPVASIRVMRNAEGSLRPLTYWTAGCETFTLSPADRRRSTMVMEDDTTERHEALKAALVADRWASVVPRG